jgi:hypothetical protein
MNGLYGLTQISPVLLFVLFLWSLLWKGIALWRASKNDQRNWFVVMLIVNTIGILEIAYLFFFAKKKMKFSELKFWESK